MRPRRGARTLACRGAHWARHSCRHAVRPPSVEESLDAACTSAQCHILFPIPGIATESVGRTPWSARPLRTLCTNEISFIHAVQADGGVGCGPGGPPHNQGGLCGRCEKYVALRTSACATVPDQPLSKRLWGTPGPLHRSLVEARQAPPPGPRAPRGPGC